MHPETWNGALALYTTAMRAAGRAAGTIRLHHHYLAMLRAQVPAPWQATAADLRTLMATPNWQPETRKSCRTVLRGFYRWGHGEGFIEDNPALVLQSIRVSPGVPRPTPPAVVDGVLGDSDRRIVFMAMLAAWCGLRVGEISRVHEHDLADAHLTVHGKGGKIRVLPIVHDPLLARLEAVRGWAFPNGRGGHLSSGHVTKLLSRALSEDWTGHTLRHRAATNALDGTEGDLLAVMTFLGHARPETTQRYTQLTSRALRAAALAARGTAA